MKRYVGIVLMLILATAAGAATQDIATATTKVSKDTGHVAKKTAVVTAHGAESGVKKLAKPPDMLWSGLARE